jgi:DNA replication and repair protein RecF
LDTDAPAPTTRPALAPLRFRKAELRSFRNIEAAALEPSAGLNVVVGDNGQGKTSLLEALYVCATSKSFRAERLAALVREGDERASVRAVVEEDGLAREQRVTLTRRSRQVELEGKRPASLSSYATRTPVVIFHPADLELVSGAASLRRRLLDRVVLFVDPVGAEARRRYLEALQSRQRALEERGPHARELTPFESVMAESGARYALAHRRAAESLSRALGEAFGRLAASGLSFEARYVGAGSEDPPAFMAALAERRAVDARRKSATFGPHRDELELELDGRSARHHASQGQQRLIALGLKLAELECVRQARGAEPILLLDDVSSELDPGRTGAVYDFVRDSACQIFVTTTRPELFLPTVRSPSDAAIFTLTGGRVARTGG